MKILFRAGFVLCGLILFLSVNCRAYDPTSDYEKRELSGWTLHINQKLASSNAPLCDEVRRLLEFQFYQIKRVVPAPALAKIQKVPLWIELNDPKFPCMCYHPSPDWLRGHDMNPEKGGGVEISNATNFLAWTHDQPWMVLHELAHSYHHQVLGYENAEIHACYENAKASGNYEKILRISGRTERHYALNNDQEYFAEATEAYFGVNDFFPFVRAELKQHDPKIYDVLGHVWGVTRPAAPPPAISSSSVTTNHSPTTGNSR